MKNAFINLKWHRGKSNGIQWESAHDGKVWKLVEEVYARLWELNGVYCTLLSW